MIVDPNCPGASVLADQAPVTEWHRFITDPTLADAILDRLIHGSHKLALRGKSIRELKSGDQ